MPSTVPGPSRVPTLHNERDRYAADRDNDSSAHVLPSYADEESVAAIHQTLTGADESEYPEPQATLDKYFKNRRPKEQSGKPLGRLGVCFKNLTTWAERNDHLSTKTLRDALWRTLTFQDIYEWTIKPWLFPTKMEHGKKLIRDFSGTVGSGEILL